MQSRQPGDRLDERLVREIQDNLLTWFAENGRDLPWRRDRNPYKVWVSEIMLQQTQVDSVIPYFNNFMEKFPTAHALAAAAEEEVIKAWEGLGYYSRARNLHSAVKEVVAEYGGNVPDDVEGISRLKGVGPYTAGAILSFAYGKAEPAVDGNVLRVIARLFCLPDDIARAATRTKFAALVRHLIPVDDAANFNEGLIELGALVCTPRNPACLHCPLREQCRARLRGVHEQLPRKKKRGKVESIALFCAVLSDGERVLLRRRPQNGLLAGMWEFPTWDSTERSLSVPGYDIDWNGPRGQVTHVFSHVKWEVTVVTGSVRSGTAHKRGGEGGASDVIDASDAGVADDVIGASDTGGADYVSYVGDVGDAGTTDRSSCDDAVHDASHSDGTAERILPPEYRFVALDALDDYAFPKVFHKVRELCEI
ncbi:A/G-specific adenine glycosylase [Numidum massiliense]|uniref:A/G-specific adenine glycosylase n=1 Tax=Numidum massiliense TaxID=1522315 RepID=UPI0006D52D96|nr:A/G-specific adenine glycosylase [Numidum massiliense]